MKKSILILTLASAWLLAGCNTVQGVGQDVQKVGEKIEDAAARKK